MDRAVAGATVLVSNRAVAVATVIVLLVAGLGLGPRAATADPRHPPAMGHAAGVPGRVPGRPESGPFERHRPFEHHRFFSRPVPRSFLVAPFIIYAVPPIVYATPPIGYTPGIYPEPQTYYSPPATYAPAPYLAPAAAYPPQTYYSPAAAYAYSPAAAYAPQSESAVATPPPTPEIVEYPSGRYELRGDGTTVPYTWVWIPNPPPAPPDSLPPSAASPVDRPERGPHSAVYRWTDDQGVVHWTDNANAVPPRFRAPRDLPGA